MKRRISAICMLVVCSLILALFSSCDRIVSPRKRKMLAYYSNETNYVKMEGTITDISGGPYQKDSYPYVYKISLDQDYFPSYYRENFSSAFFKGDTRFEIYTVEDYYFPYSAEHFDLQVGDRVSLISAPDIFFDSQIYPLLFLEKDGVIYIPFEEAKEKLIEWITECRYI